MARKRIERSDGSTINIYAPGDGHLSFVRADQNGRAVIYDVTDDEANELCPPGWVIYRDGPYHRAAPRSDSE